MQEPPQFTRLLRDQAAARGSSVRLACHLTGMSLTSVCIEFLRFIKQTSLFFVGYPDPDVVWLRGEEPVLESSSVQIEYEEDGRCTLVLSDVGSEDADVYTCRATNNHGETFCSAQLRVLPSS